MEIAESISIPIKSDKDVLAARQRARELAMQRAMPSGDQTIIAAAVSELARNIVLYAREGEIVVEWVDDGPKTGIVIVARDRGPGIQDVPKALTSGYSTSRGLGLGLPGVRRLVDEFEIVSAVDNGTTVTVRKWSRPRPSRPG